MRSSIITLFIDTSTSHLYAGIVENQKLLIEIQECLGKELSTYALAKIEEMFKKINKRPQDIDEIIVVNGPGSFTGIRIGITIAKTYAWALQKDIKTISSLEAMAVSNEIQKLKVPVIDARRGYVFAGIYNKENEVVLEEQYLKLETLIKTVEEKNEPYEIISNDNLPTTVLEYRPDILQIVLYARGKKSVNPHAVNPTYLKRTEAEETKGIVAE